MSALQSLLKEHRDAIDTIDADVIALLNKRALLSFEIGKLKHDNGNTSIKDASREQVIIDNLTNTSNGPLHAEQISALYHLIFSQSRQIQEDLKNA
ncbi:MAG: hypothetical protein COB66_06280 [Coxiella sp. (in: Bacteria)]|nr:MAG: hypothetical protein COB66_06280 [Coxiella sp. (in: g-proteobacteria)]